MKHKIYLSVTFLFIAAIALGACRPWEKTSEKATLEGTLWSLNSYANSQGDLVDVLPSSKVTAEFTGVQVEGAAGCNNYFGMYTVDGKKLAIEGVGATMMFCAPEELMAQESDYLAALGTVASYKITGNHLQLANKAGKTVLTFTETQPMPLAGTTWQLMYYNNGKQGFASVLAGTETTAIFDADGEVSGSAGCNNYSASYEVEGDKITIGPAAATRMMCAEPEGIMEQESAYLAALETATTYQIKGAELELTKAGGTRVATFTVAP